MPNLEALVSLLDSLRGAPPDMGELQANAKLNQQGSVMGSEREAQRSLDRSPVRGTIQELLESLNPMEWMSGPGQAAFGPIRTAAQKKIVKAAFRASPDVVKEVIDMPETLQVGVNSLSKRLPQTASPLAADASGFYLPGELNVNPSVMRGRLPISNLEKKFAEAAERLGLTQKLGLVEKTENLPVTAAHEMQHHINRFRIMPRLTAGEEGPASIAGRISTVLPQGQGRGQVAELFKAGQKNTAVDESLAYLREAAIRNPNDPNVQALVAEFLNRGR